MKNPTLLRLLQLCLWALLCAIATQPTAAKAQAPRAVWVRVQLLEPAGAGYKVHLGVRPNYGTNIHFVVGQTVSGMAKGQYTAPAEAELDKLRQEVQPLAGQPTAWIDLTPHIPEGALATVQFFFEPKADFTGKGVKARFDVATAATDAAIVRSITDHDPGNVISLRVPADPAKDKQWLLSIREDAQRRLDEIRSWKLPSGPLPKKIWTMTGFRPWDTYTDPEIMRLDFQVIRELGMNGFWDYDADKWAMASPMGINRTTFFWRAPGAPPGYLTAEGVRMNWPELEKWTNEAYERDIKAARAFFPGGKLPLGVVDMMDEPAGITFGGPEVAVEFRKYLQAQGLTPQFFGKASWDEVQPLPMDPKRYFWWDFFTTRDKLDLKDINVRRSFYWSTRFWGYANARIYALANSAVARLAPEIAGTRVNLGPPWYYDYGTIPRGIDNIELGAQRGVTMAFNEDWIGNGDPRWPLESNTLLADWTRAPLRGTNPKVGGFLTRDANRTSVKLRAYGFLARGATVFDFYYYGPSYGHFDHWSDNSSMARGVAEFTRDVGQVDDILAEAKPPQPRVALLYPRSWPVWKRDETELIEWTMTYMALLHSHIPVDIVSDAEVNDGRFAAAKYRCLYVVNESVPRQTAAAILRWVGQGGRLWASGWAGAHDEYDTPTDIWNPMLGARSRTWKPAGDLKRMGETVEYANERRPYFSRQSQIVPAQPDKIRWLERTARVTPPNETAAKAYRFSYGSGLVQVVPWTAGKDYIDGIQKKDGSIAPGAILYPSDARRDVITGFALAAVQPPATSSVSQILAWPLWAAKSGVVLLPNFTGEPAREVTIRFTAPRSIASIRSLRRGKLNFKTQKGQTTCILPVEDVTDMLVVTLK